MADTTKKPSIEVTLVTDEIAGAVAEFFRAVWDPNASAEKVRRGRAQANQNNPFFPGQDFPTTVFLSDGHVLGYCGSIPVMVWSGGAEQRAEWIKGLMVLPEHRKGPIGFSLVKELLRHLERPLSLVVGEAPRRLFTAFGMVDLGLVPNYLRPLHTGTLLKRLDLESLGVSGAGSWKARVVKLAQRMRLASVLGACADGAIRLKVTFHTANLRSLKIETSGPLPDRTELDTLWGSVRTQITAASIRDGRYLLWRYGDASVYATVIVRCQQKLLGFAAVRRPRAEGDARLKGIHIAVLSDLLFPPDRPDVASALFTGAETVAKVYGADALLCSASHSAVTRLLPSHGFFSVPANIHFMLANKSGQNAFPSDLSSWWITRGDSNADEVF